MSGRVNEAAEPQTEAGQAMFKGMVDPVMDDWYTADLAGRIIAIEREATERATAAVDVERLRVAIRLAHDEIAATDRLSLAIDEPLLIATKYDEMTNAARLSGESE